MTQSPEKPDRERPWFKPLYRGNMGRPLPCDDKGNILPSRFAAKAKPTTPSPADDAANAVSKK
jgi:hypothetical protein